MQSIMSGDDVVSVLLLQGWELLPAHCLLFWADLLVWFAPAVRDSEQGCSWLVPMGVETLKLQGRSLTSGVSLGRFVIWKLCAGGWLPDLALPSKSTQFWLMFVAENFDIWGFYQGWNTAAGGFWGLGSWAGVEDPWTTQIFMFLLHGANWRPEVSRLGLCTEAAGSLGRDFAVLCKVISSRAAHPAVL